MEGFVKEMPKGEIVRVKLAIPDIMAESVIA